MKLNLEEYKNYLVKIGFAGNSLNTYPSYISENKLDILNKIDRYKNLTDEEKLIKFANENNDFKDEFNRNHIFASPDTFNDLRSGARRYKYFLQYQAIMLTMKDYDTNKEDYELNDAYMFYKVFTENIYPVKAICRKNLSILELNDDFRTSEAKSKLNLIFNMRSKTNIIYVDIREDNQVENLEPKICNIIKNIILYGAPGVGKTHNTQKLIRLIESGVDEKETFQIIEENILNDGVEAEQVLKNIQKRVKFITFHQSYSYEDFIEGFKPTEDGGVQRQDGIFKEIVEDAKADRENKYYLIIDEINRGNISKIFGELITLIEEDKRDLYEVTLPYSKKSFSIPSNLYIIATMNSTDKSIATIDIALRRRFAFLKMKPNVDLVENSNAKALMLKLNEFIENSLGEDYKLGHSYFMRVQDDEDLEFIKKYKIKPLLEEYFYADEQNFTLIENILNENRED